MDNPPGGGAVTKTTERMRSPNAPPGAAGRSNSGTYCTGLAGCHTTGSKSKGAVPRAEAT